MSRQPKACRPRRASLCLLAAGALTEQERASLVHHLAECAKCQAWYGEVKRVAAPMAAWEDSYSNLEANRDVQARWAEDFSAALAPTRPQWLALLASILGWGRDMVGPCRRIWAGFAAVWVALVAFNLVTREPAQSPTAITSRPSPGLVKAYLAGDGFVTEGLKPRQTRPAPPPEPRPPSKG